MHFASSDMAMLLCASKHGCLLWCSCVGVAFTNLRQCLSSNSLLHADACAGCPAQLMLPGLKLPCFLLNHQSNMLTHLTTSCKTSGSHSHASMQQYTNCSLCLFYHTCTFVRPLSIKKRQTGRETWQLRSHIEPMHVAFADALLTFACFKPYTALFPHGWTWQTHQKNRIFDPRRLDKPVNRMLG